jgi:hypothetical protein
MLCLVIASDSGTGAAHHHTNARGPAARTERPEAIMRTRRIERRTTAGRTAIRRTRIPKTRHLSH